MGNRRSLKDTINCEAKKEQELSDFIFKQSTAEKNGHQQSSELKEISVESIHRTRIQKRRYFDAEKIKEWAENEIKLNGIRSPLWVRPLPNGKKGEYELVAGERRYRAALYLNKETVPTRVFHLTDKEALIASLVENMQRQDLNPLEETEGTLAAISAELNYTDEESIRLLYQMNNASKGKINQNILVSPEAKSVETVFSTLGRLSWKSFVAARLPLLKKPQDILEALREGRIEYTKAMLIAKIKDKSGRKEVLAQAADEKWTLSEVKSHISLLLEINEDGNQNTLEKDVNIVFREFKKSKVWDDPKKKKKIEKLLEQIRKLMD